MSDNQRQLFKTRIVPVKPGSGKLFEEEFVTNDGPEDLVLDGFCGSGMTGVAAQWYGSASDDCKRKVEARFEKQSQTKPTWGGANCSPGMGTTK